MYCFKKPSRNDVTVTFRRQDSWFTSLIEHYWIKDSWSLVILTVYCTIINLMCYTYLPSVLMKSGTLLFSCWSVVERYPILCDKLLWMTKHEYKSFLSKKRYYVFDLITRCVCLSSRLWARWLHSATWCQVRLTLSTRTRNCNTSQDDPFPNPVNMDHPDHITFWPITSKVMDGFTPNCTCM